MRIVPVARSVNGPETGVGGLPGGMGAAQADRAGPTGTLVPGGSAEHGGPGGSPQPVDVRTSSRKTHSAPIRVQNAALRDAAGGVASGVHRVWIQAATATARVAR